MQIARRFTKMSAPLIVVIFALPVLIPYLTERLLWTFDGLLHVDRIIQVDHLIRQGVLFTRWLPDLGRGYGFPLFNYYAPLSTYLVEPVVLLGGSPALALNLGLGLGFVLTGLSTYLLADELFGRRAGVVAGIAAMYAPYTHFNASQRGALPEMLALAIAPLAFWGVARALRTDRPRDYLLGGVALALVVLAHNPISALVAPFLGAFGLILALERRDLLAARLARAALIPVLGMLLSAGLWLPSLAEMNAIQFWRGYNFDQHFAPLAWTFDLPSLPIPTDLINPPVRPGYSSVQAILGLTALWGVGLLPRGRMRRSALFFLGGWLLTLIMLMPDVGRLWFLHTPLRFIQFPTRLLGPGSLMLAVVVGVTAQMIPSRRFAAPLVALVCAVYSLATLGWLFPRTSDPPADQTIAGVVERESAEVIGTTAYGEFLPRWAESLPGQTPLEAAYRAGEPIRRFDETRLPPGTRLLDAEYLVNRARIELETPEAFEAVYLTFYFPGWRVWIDGLPSAIAPTRPEGLIAFDVPPGHHQIEVRFGPTPIRIVGGLIALLGLAGVGVWAMRHKPRPAPIGPKANITNAEIGLLLVIGLLAIGLRVWLGENSNPLRRPALSNETLAGVQHPLGVDYEGQMRLLGYDLAGESAPSDGLIKVDLYWKVIDDVGVPYSTAVAVLDEDGRVWSDASPLRPPDYRPPPSTEDWALDEYALDSFEMRLLPGTPPDRYLLVAEAFNRFTLYPLTPDEGHAPGGHPGATIGSITVTPPRRVSPPELPAIQYPLGAHLGDLRLLGYALDREEAAPGDPFLMTLLWQAEVRPSLDYRLQVDLLDAEGRPALSEQAAPGMGRYPPSAWRSGEVVRDQITLRLPAGLASGVYTWRVALIGEDGQPIGEAVEVGQLSVVAPERMADLPAGLEPVGVTFGGQITLAGVGLPDLLTPGGTLPVMLAWRAEAQISTGYKVFVHLVRPDGAIAAQSDAIPANWARPTTGWLPGEIVIDEHTITLPPALPPGQYMLRVGLYDPVTGKRLTTPSGDEWATLGTLRLAE
jgi:4-amino-4-deoxy-L-arabinose transferase-like glycosyltransferase